MCAVGDKHRGTIRPEFDRSISIDFRGAKITSDTGFLLMREMDQRFNLGDAGYRGRLVERGLRNVIHYSPIDISRLYLHYYRIGCSS